MDITRGGQNETAFSLGSDGPWGSLNAPPEACVRIVAKRCVRIVSHILSCPSRECAAAISPQVCSQGHERASLHIVHILRIFLGGFPLPLRCKRGPGSRDESQA